MAKQFTLHSAEAYSVPFQTSEAVVWRCSVEKVFLEISQNSHKKACARVSFLSKVTGQRPATLLKKRLSHRSFPVNFAKFLRAPFFTEHFRWLLLNGTKTSPMATVYRNDKDCTVAHPCNSCNAI